MKRVPACVKACCKALTALLPVLSIARQLAGDSLQLFRAALEGCRFPQLLDLQVCCLLAPSCRPNPAILTLPPLTFIMYVQNRKARDM